MEGDGYGSGMDVQQLQNVSKHVMWWTTQLKFSFYDFFIIFAFIGLPSLPPLPLQDPNLYKKIFKL